MELKNTIIAYTHTHTYTLNDWNFLKIWIIDFLGKKKICWLADVQSLTEVWNWMNPYSSLFCFFFSQTAYT